MRINKKCGVGVINYKYCNFNLKVINFLIYEIVIKFNSNFRSAIYACE